MRNAISRETTGSRMRDIESDSVSAISLEHHIPRQIMRMECLYVNGLEGIVEGSTGL